MATERLDIIVTQRGTRSVRRDLQGVGDSAGRAQSGIRLLNRALGALLGGAVASGLIRLADSFTIIQNRLKTVTTGTANLNAVTNRLFAISNRTRTSFESTAQVYARTAASVKSLGTSQEETLNFTESLSQAVQLSGATATEASNALIQLSQGLGSGALRGDELRSVLEQLPFVADVIAKSLGVTRGQLRLLGTDGKITGEVVLKAFRDAREEIATAFAKSTITASQGFVVLQNELIRYVGGLNESFGITRAFGSLLVLLGTNLDTVGRIVAALATTIITVYIGGAIRPAIAATRAFTLALLANPFGVLLAGVVAVSAALVTFSDRILLSAGGAATLADFFVAAFNEIRAAASSVVQFLSPAFEAIRSVAENAFGGIEISFAGAIRVIAQLLDGFVTQFSLVPRLIVAIFTNLPGVLGNIFVTAFNSILDNLNSFLSKITAGINAVLSFTGSEGINAPQLSKIENTFEGAGGRLGSALGEALFTSFSTFSEATERVFLSSEERAQARIKARNAQAAEETRATAALSQTGTRNIPPTGSRTASSRRGPRFEDAIRRLDQQRILLGANAREQERLNTHFSVSNRLRRELSATERAALDIKITELQFARDSIAIQEVLNRLGQESRVLSADGALQRSQVAATLQLEDQIKRQLTTTEQGLIFAQVERNEALRTQAQILDQLRGPGEEFASRQAALRVLLDSGKISIDEYNRVLRESAIAALETGVSIGDGLSRGLLKIQGTVTDLASVVDGALTNAFRGAEDAFVNFVQTGQFSFSGLVDSIVADVARLAFRQAVGGLFGGGGGGGGGGLLGGLGGVVGGLFGGGGGGGLLGGIGSAVSGLFGFANGGDFTVAGRGGRDNNILSVNGAPVAAVSRGETVAVSPQGGSQRPVIVNFNFAPGTDAASFQRSQGQIMARTQQALSRASTRNN